MIKYKYIHKDSGYESLISTNDTNKSFQINRLMENIQGNIASKSGEKIYAYFYNENEVIYYKEKNTLVNALIDENNEIKNIFPTAYPSEIIFNELLLPIDNLPLNSSPIKPAQMNIPNILVNDLQYVPLMVDALLDNKKIVLIANNVEQLKNFIMFVLYLFPVNFSRKIGYIVNLAYLPNNLYHKTFESVNIFGFTEDNEIDSVDLVINLKQPYHQEIELSPFAKVLDYDKMNLLQLQRKSKELYSLFDENGNYISSKSKNVLIPLIFEREKTVVNADKLLDVLLESNENINLSIFNNLANFILNNNFYTGSLMKKIDTLIEKKEELKQFEIRFKEKKIKSYLEDLNKTTPKELQEIVNFITNDNVMIDDEIKTALNRQRTNPFTYDLIFEMAVNSNDIDKQIYCAEFIRYDRIYNLNINSQSFEEFFTNKIKKLNSQNDILNISKIYLYSTIKYDKENIFQAQNRKKQFIDTLRHMSLEKNFKMDLIFELYENINELIKRDIPDRISDYFDFELFPNETLNLIIKLYKSDEKKEYLKLIDYVLLNKNRTYGAFYHQLLDFILIGKTVFNPDKYLYEKYINVYNYEKFIKVLELAGTLNQQEYQNFISALEKEENISKNLAPYRLNYIFSCYSNSSVIVKKKIAKELKLEYDENVDETIKKYVYNDLEKEDTTKIDLQKQTIDTIIDYVEVNDTIISKKNENSSKKALEICLISLCFAIITFLLFNIPTFLKMFLINKNFLTIFFEYNNIITPYIFCYGFIFFLIAYAINIKKTRGNMLQAVERTVIKWLLFVIIPVLMYVITYLFVYFVF